MDLFAVLRFPSFVTVFLICLNIRASDGGIPNLGSGLLCDRDAGYREYCDSAGSGEVKQCSPCNAENLARSYIDHPKECEGVPCPFQCPEGLDETNPAPCDVRAHIVTTPDMTTLDEIQTDSTTLMTMPALTTEELTTFLNPSSTSTSSAQPSLVANFPLWAIIMIAVVSTSVVGACICLCCWYLYRRYSRKEYSNTTSEFIVSRSGDPLIQTPVGNGSEGSASSSSPVRIIPSSTSILVRAIYDNDTFVTTRDESVAENGIFHLGEDTNKPNVYCRLECPCGGEPTPVGPDGASFPNLQPKMTYKVIVGTKINGEFVRDSSDTVETSGEFNANACSMSLLDLRSDTSLRENYGRLCTLFSRIDDEKLLQSLCLTLGHRVQQLKGAVGTNFWETILDIDKQLRPTEESSLKVIELLEALRVGVPPNGQMPGCVVDIAVALSGLHLECVSCKHMVHQVSGNSPQMMTTAV